MIHYKRGRICSALTSIWVLQDPVFRTAFIVALPAAMVAGGIKLLDSYLPEGQNNFLEKVVVAAAYGSFSFMVGLTVVFRTSQSYSRYWEGCDVAYVMMADFFDVASSLIAFCKAAPAHKQSEVLDFQSKLIRLVSLLHALILADLEAEGDQTGSEKAYRFELIDIEGLDATSLQTVLDSHNKVDLVFQWIQSLMVESIRDEIICVAPPIATRAFQELNAGMIQFHKALKISECPFPFPYTAAAEMVLCMHWIVTPLVVGMWTEYTFPAVFFTFVSVFILWSLNGIATELENPFESDMNDLDMSDMQRSLNERLLLLLDSGTIRVPLLSKAACRSNASLRSRQSRHGGLISIDDILSHPPSAWVEQGDEPIKDDKNINSDSCDSPPVDRGTQGAFYQPVDADAPLLKKEVEFRQHPRSSLEPFWIEFPNGQPNLAKKESTGASPGLSPGQQEAASASASDERPLKEQLQIRGPGLETPQKKNVETKDDISNLAEGHDGVLIEIQGADPSSRPVCTPITIGPSRSGPRSCSGLRAVTEPQEAPIDVSLEGWDCKPICR